MARVLCRCASRWVTTCETSTASAFFSRAVSTRSGTDTCAPMLVTDSSE